MMQGMEDLPLEAAQQTQGDPETREGIVVPDTALGGATMQSSSEVRGHRSCAKGTSFDEKMASFDEKIVRLYAEQAKGHAEQARNYEETRQNSTKMVLEVLDALGSRATS